MKVKVIYICFIALIISACESTVTNFKFKEKDPKLVIIGFAGADTTPEMHVSRSISLTESLGYYPIKNAIFKIYNNSSNSLLGVLDIDTNDYYTNPNIYFQAGESYRVEVEAEGFTKVTANFDVPEITNIIDVSTSIMQERDQYEDYYSEYFDVKVQIETSTEETEYFEVELFENYISYEYDDFGVVVDSSYEIRSSGFYSQGTNIAAIREFGDNYFLASQEYQIMGEGVYLSNEFEKGNVLNFNLEIPIDTYYSYYDDPHIFDPSSSLYSYVLYFNRIDENTFEYAASRARQGETEYNPFVEQVSIFTNVEKGLGIVGGRTKNSIQLDLSELVKDAAVKNK